MTQPEHEGTEVVIPLDRAIEIARDLECIVVSLDRIGSRRAGGDADAETLDLFLTDWRVAQRLARARGVMWDAIATVVGEEAVEEIAGGVPRFPGEPPSRMEPEQPNEQPNRRAAADEHGRGHHVQQEDQAADQRAGTDS